MFKLKSNDIEYFPFEDYSELKDRELQTMAESHRLSNYNSWMLPQILQHYGRWQLHYDQQGQVDTRETARQNMQTRWAVGLWRVVTRLKRSTLVATQNRQDWARYSALVPLIPAGVKQSQGTKYQQWDDQFHQVVHEQLWEAMQYVPPAMTTAELLDCRERGLQVASTGTAMLPTNRWCLSHQQHTPLHDAPALAGTMLTQIWCAHPTLRHELMVLDPQNWDRMPPALISDEVVEKESRGVPRPVADELRLPWE